MATNAKLLTAVFQNRSDAIAAFQWLQQRGYQADEINVLMTDRTRNELRDEGQADRIAPGNMASEGMAAGGALGTAAGAALATLAVIASIGTWIALPGLGILVAGPVLAALAGGGAGAIAGGALGGLIGLGISESNAKAYEEALRNGGVAIGVAPHSADDAEKIEMFFEGHHANNVVYS